MAEQPNSPAPRRGAVERLVSRSFEDESGFGRPLSQRARQRERTVENYLRAGTVPRYMQRLREIHQLIDQQRRQVARAYRELQESCAPDNELFARRWRARAQAWPFDEVNELIREHNQWYPVEAQLPMDPRTRDYVLIVGRSYRRAELGPQWVLEQFPPALPSRAP